MRVLLIKESFLVAFLWMILAIPVTQAQATIITAPDTILVWFVEIDGNGNPRWKDIDGNLATDECNPKSDLVPDNDNDPPRCVFIPQDISPNPRPIAFETNYLPAVVGGEIGDENIEAVKAQAVAARSFALYNINNPDSYCINSCHVTQSTSHQYYEPSETKPKSLQAVNATQHLYLTYPISSEIEPIFSQFSRDHAGPYTVADANLGYLASVYDPIAPGDPDDSSHGKGMSQLGAIRWAEGMNSGGVPYPKWDYTKILTHYYTGVRMRNGSTGALHWTGYRWNMIDAYINPEMYTDEVYEDPYMRIQNTGMHPFPSGTQLVYRAKSVSSSGSIAYTDWMTVPATAIPLLAPGSDAALAHVSATIPSWFYKGRASYSYQLEWDLARESGVKFHEYGYGWLTQEIPIKLRKRPDPVNCKTCPSASSSSNSAVVDWHVTHEPDAISYIWERYNTGLRTLTGLVTVPDGAAYGSTTVPLVEGPNTLYIRAAEQADPSNTSQLQPLAEILYDSTPSALSLSSSQQWVQSGGAVNVTFSIDDSSLGSGVNSYTLTQKHPNGSTIVLQSQSNMVNTLALPPTAVSATIQGGHGETTIFELSTIDQVGNLATTTVRVAVDAEAPLLLQSDHPIWTNQATVPVPWQVHDGGIGVQRVAVAYRRAGDNWTMVPAVTYAPPYPAAPTGTITLTGLRDGSTYELRYTLIDGFGNQRTELKTIKTDFTAPTASIPDISDPGDTTIFIPQAWTELLVAGNDGGNYPSGIAYYEVRYGTERMLVNGRREVRWLGSRFIGHAGGYTLRFKAPENARYVFAVRARDWAGNLSTWSAPTLPYQFSTGYGGYYDGYRELYLPLFRPTVVPFPSAPPQTQATEQRGTWTPYPLPQK